MRCRISSFLSEDPAFPPDPKIYPEARALALPLRDPKFLIQIELAQPQHISPQRALHALTLSWVGQLNESVLNDALSEVYESLHMDHILNPLDPEEKRAARHRQLIRVFFGTHDLLTKSSEARQLFWHGETYPITDDAEATVTTEEPAFEDQSIPTPEFPYWIQDLCHHSSIYFATGVVGLVSVSSGNTELESQFEGEATL